LRSIICFENFCLFLFFLEFPPSSSIFLLSFMQKRGGPRSTSCDAHKFSFTHLCFSSKFFVCGQSFLDHARAECIFSGVIRETSQNISLSVVYRSSLQKATTRSATTKKQRKTHTR
jgi:hypothetical protein